MNKRVDFLSPVSIIPGFGDKRVTALQEAGIFTVGDLLYRLPRRYINRTQTLPINELVNNIGNEIAIAGEIHKVQSERGRKRHLKVILQDSTGSVELLWFNSAGYMSKTLAPGMKIRALGKPQFYKQIQIAHPEIEIDNTEPTQELPFEPRYSLSEKMRSAKLGQKRLLDAVKWLFKNITHFPEKLPVAIDRKYKFPPLRDSLYHLHFPKDPNLNDHWKSRIKYEELYQTALNLRWLRRNFSLPGIKMRGEELREEFLKMLPFCLTNEQEEAVAILSKESASPLRMHRLLQGDVGCGKTVTAFIAALPALQTGLQVVWVTPTEVLARQSFKEISSWLVPLGFSVSLLSGSTQVKEKRKIIHELKTGTISFIVGTHALLQERVGFHQPGMIIVDEQHRFGTQQRLALQHKAPAADLLMMSATPIPQSLASTIYSDLNLLTIPTVPSGRKPIKTHLVAESKRADMEQFIHTRVTEFNEQIFWIVPRIDSTDEEINDLADTEGRFKQLSTGMFKDIPINILHGGMSSTGKESVMESFSNGEIKILIATTVVEVGINVPTATIMVIENSERFGLAQLHQLRGRVGRGNRDSWAFLMGGEKIAEESVRRLQNFANSKDGFEIAELDLNLRGTGQIVGFRQSGFSELQFSNILKDADLFQEAVEDINTLLQL